MRAALCLLAVMVIVAATQARLSQYHSVMAPVTVVAKATKLAEFRFEKFVPAPALTVTVAEIPLSSVEPILRAADVNRGSRPLTLSPLRT